MKVTKVRVTYGRTINLENFNSLRVDCELTADINQDAENPKMSEDYNKVAEFLREECRNQCKAEADRLLEDAVR